MFSKKDAEAEIKRIEDEVISTTVKIDYHQREADRLINENEEIRDHFLKGNTLKIKLNDLQREKRVWETIFKGPKEHEEKKREGEPKKAVKEKPPKK